MTATHGSGTSTPSLPFGTWGDGRLPIAKSSLSVRQYQVLSTSAGGAMTLAFSSFTRRSTIACVTGLISSWSGPSGVVLPAFLPTVPSLVARVGRGDPLEVALSINIGSLIVDVSPLSTLGALCVATMSDPAETRILFRRLLVWGLSMTVVGALIAQAMAGAF